MEGINIRFAKIIDFKGLNTNSAGKKLNTSDVVIGNIVKGKNPPSYKIIKELLELFVDINPEWLLIGRGSMLRDTRPPAAGQESPPVAAPAAVVTTICPICQAKDAVIEAKNALIEAKDSLLAAKEATIHDKDAIIAARDKEIHCLASELATQKKEVIAVTPLDAPQQPTKPKSA